MTPASGSTSLREERQALLEEIRTELHGLSQSPLYDFRRQNGYEPVIGEGDPLARIVFVGEAPGEQEARTGRPFVGPAGKILDELLAGIGLKREQVYITNVVKDRPPGNRDPRSDEIQLYGPFLLRQLGIIQPAVIATLGRFSLAYLLARFGVREAGGAISKLHGQPIPVRASYGQVTIVPLFHPAAAFYVEGRREVMEQDFQALKRYLEKVPGTVAGAGACLGG